MIQQIDSERYKEYYALNDADRKRLKEINFYRSKNELPLIEVPKSDAAYWKQVKTKKHGKEEQSV